MKRFLLIGALLCAVVMFTNTSQVRADTPEAVVKEMMGKIKESGSPAPFIEYVNWPAAFKDAPPQMKSQMNITSAEQMKETFRRMFTETKAFFREQMQQRIASMPQEQRGVYESNLERMGEMIDQQQEQMKQQIRDTEYTVGKAKVDGDSATVLLTQSYQGQSREREIQLSKVDGEWLLDSASIFSQEEQAAPPPSAPPATQTPQAAESPAPAGATP